MPAALLAGLLLVVVPCGSAWAADAPVSSAPDSVSAEEARRAQALFARYWEESAQRFPEWATWRGDHRFDDRLRDASPAAEAADEAWTDGLLAEARRLDARRLPPQDQVSLALFIDGIERDLTMRAYPGFRHQSLSSLWGFQSMLAGLLRAMPAESAARAEQALARMAAYPRRVDQEIERLRDAAARGWVAPRPVLDRVLSQIDGQLAPPPREGPFFEPMRHFPPELAEPERAALAARAEAAIAEQVMPAQRRLRAFVADELLPRAPVDGGLWRYPDGDAVYAARVRDLTTTELTPRQVHDLGLNQLERLHREFAEVQAALKIEGGFADMVARLNGPEYRYPSAEALLDGYRAVAKRIDPVLPTLFAELPRAPYGIRPIPAFMGAGAADNYNRPPPDGSAPGWYNANVLAWDRRPRWALPTLVAHETVPGHHLQNARSVELGKLPDFRRNGGYVAFGEGWALYAETLGNRFGLYERPEDRFGHLQGQALRAARLVVDTGLHAFHWTREQAIDFMQREVGEDPEFIATEVDRYQSNPGQALGYMIGQLKIIELRDRAQAVLGDRFDLRRFHNAVIDQGALPLNVLDQQINAWIARERAAVASRPAG